MVQRANPGLCSYLPNRRSPIYLLFIALAIIILFYSKLGRNAITEEQASNEKSTAEPFAVQKLDAGSDDKTDQEQQNIQQPETDQSRTSQSETKGPETGKPAISTKPAGARQYYEAHKYDFTTGGYQNFYNSMLEQRLLFSFYLNDLEEDQLSSQQKLRQVCIFQTENSPRRFDVANGYDCLLQLQVHESGVNPQVDSYRVIKYGSLSLETIYTPTAATNLMRAIVSGYEDKVPFLKDSSDLTKCCSGYRKDEEQFLEKVLQLDIAALNERVWIRQSFIHMYGRSSLNENTTQINLPKSIERLNRVRYAMRTRQSNIFDIALTANNDDVVGLAICIVSALVNSDFVSFYKFHVVMDPENRIPVETQMKLASFTKIRDYSIDFTAFPVNLVKDVKDRLGAKGERLVTMYRLYLDKIYPDLDTVLYLDTNTIVLRDLTYLKTIDMTNYIWAGGPSLNYRYDLPQCNGILPHYFINAGVLFVNLTNSRRVSIHDKFADHMMFNGECGRQEQDLINGLFADYIYFLPHRWNAIVIPYNQRFHFSSFIVRHIGESPQSDREEHLFENTFQEAPCSKLLWDRYRELTGF